MNIQDWAKRKLGMPRFAGRDGLVEVEREVTRSTGKSHRQKFWVKPQDIKPGDKVTKGKAPVGAKGPAGGAALPIDRHLVVPRKDGYEHEAFVEKLEKLGYKAGKHFDEDYTFGIITIRSPKMAADPRVIEQFRAAKAELDVKETPEEKQLGLTKSPAVARAAAGEGRLFTPEGRLLTPEK